MPETHSKNSDNSQRPESHPNNTTTVVNGCQFLTVTVTRPDRRVILRPGAVTSANSAVCRGSSIIQSPNKQKKDGRCDSLFVHRDSPGAQHKRPDDPGLSLWRVHQVASHSVPFTSHAQRNAGAMRQPRLSPAESPFLTDAARMRFQSSFAQIFRSIIPSVFGQPSRSLNRLGLRSWPTHAIII
jgi:hypothetical protein